MPYADEKYYTEKYSNSEIEDIEKYLELASRDINTLTFNRIIDVGFENLTEFQQNLIKDVCCELAEFKYENQDLLDTIFSSYSINGVSMGIDKSWNIKIISGIAIPKNTYSLLEQTGLTCRSFRW